MKLPRVSLRWLLGSVAVLASHYARTALDIAESTAHDHIKRMMLKTRARNRVELAAKALGWRGA